MGCFNLNFHICLKQQLHSNDRGLMNEPELRTDEWKTLFKKKKSLPVGREFRPSKNAFSLSHGFAFYSENCFVKM